MRQFLFGAAFLCAACGSAFGQVTGPSTSTSPYILATDGFAHVVQTKSLFTVGDSVGGYRMVGIPDGLGGFSNGDGTFTLLMNHELGGSAGTTRAHGSTGAFVSRWVIDANGNVISGRDHNTSGSDVYSYNSATGQWNSGSATFNRFCSSDLATPSAYRFGEYGTDARIYMNGEESGAEGRAYAHIVSGAATNQTWELAHLGKFSWENSTANSYAQRKTVVMGTDDSSNNGQVYMYVGTKQNTGNDIERAGLTNGKLYGVSVAGSLSEDRNAPPPANTRFSMFDHGNVSSTTGAALNTASVNAGVMNFNRPEDGAWDTRAGHENDYYFVTTDRFNDANNTGRSRLWRMRFDDITNPEAGGTLSCLLNGTEGQQMMDNLCIDSHGRIIIQEDPGNNAHDASIWMFDTTTGNFMRIAQHDPSRFVNAGPGFLTRDEESSGIIDAKDLLGDGWYLLDTQAHYSISGELVEGGQLMAMYIDPNLVPAPGAIALMGMGGLMAARRRR